MPINQGYCTLSEALKLVSPTVKYTTEHARIKLLQMSLVSIRVGDPLKGQSFSILMEKFPGAGLSMDYQHSAQVTKVVISESQW